jgi:hypothetical protein
MYNKLTMKQRIIILSSLFAVALLITSIYFALFRGESDTSLIGNDTVLPVNGGNTLVGINNQDPQTNDAPSLKLKSGGRLSVQNFLNEPDVEQLADDYYRVFDEQDKDGSYASAYYYTEDGGMIILLTREPLALSRSLAEQQLKDRLGLSEDAMCELEVLVQTNRFVNLNYAGRNLGLSFCSGSVALQ